MTRWGFAFLFCAVAATGADAQTAATIVAPASATAAIPQPDGSIVFVEPLINGLMPYIVSGIGAIIVAINGLIVAWLRSKWKNDAAVDDIATALDLFRKAAQTQAGVVIAKLDGAAMNASIDVKSPIIADATNKVLARLPEEAAKVNMTPDKLADMITGEIGKMQAAGPIAAVAQTGKTAT